MPYHSPYNIYHRNNTDFFQSRIFDLHYSTIVLKRLNRSIDVVRGRTLRQGAIHMNMKSLEHTRHRPFDNFGHILCLLHIRRSCKYISTN